MLETSLSSSYIQRRSQCKLCQKSFRRDDYLRRHELNHRLPQHPCHFPGCGQRFHRRDVLKRHSLCHVPGQEAASHSQDRSPLLALDDQPFDISGILPDNSLQANALETAQGLQSSICDGQDSFLFFCEDIPCALDADVRMNRCIEFYFQYEAPRLPCVHKSQINDHMALRYAMAALGALHNSRAARLQLSLASGRVRLDCSSGRPKRLRVSRRTFAGIPAVPILRPSIGKNGLSQRHTGGQLIASM